MAKDGPNLEEEIALASQLFELEKQVKKKKSIENIGYFADPEREKKKKEETAYNDFMDWICLITLLDAEISREEMYENDKTKSEDKNWQQRNQEYFINKLKLVRNNKHGWREEDEQ